MVLFFSVVYFSKKGTILYTMDCNILKLAKTENAPILQFKHGAIEYIHDLIFYLLYNPVELISQNIIIFCQKMEIVVLKYYLLEILLLLTMLNFSILIFIIKTGILMSK